MIEPKRLTAFLDYCPEALFVDIDGLVVYANRACMELFGYKRATDILGKESLSFFEGQDRIDLASALFAGMKNKNQFRAKVKIKKLKGKETVKLALAPYIHENEAGTIFLLTPQSTDDQLPTNQNESQATHDPLTGLPTKTLFQEYGAQAINYVEKMGGSVLVALIAAESPDLDLRRLAKKERDFVLLTLGRRLSSCLGPLDCIGRVDEETFAVLLYQLNTDDEAVPLLQRLLLKANESFSPSKKAIIVNWCATAAVSGIDGGDIKTILSKLGQNLSKSRLVGKHAILFSHQEFQKRFESKLKIKAALRQGLDQQKLQVKYRPQISCDSGKIIGFSAHINWDNSELDIQSNQALFDLARESSLQFPLISWLLRTVCHDIQQWKDQEPEYLSVSLHLPSTLLQAHGFPALVEQMLEEYEIPANCLELKFNLVDYDQQDENTHAFFSRLHEIGVSLAIGNCTAHSIPFSKLASWPVNTFEMAPRDVLDITLDLVALAATESWSVFANRLRRKLRAVSVETAGQLSKLFQLGCHVAEGDLICKELDFAACEKLLRQPYWTLPESDFWSVPKLNILVLSNSEKQQEMLSKKISELENFGQIYQTVNSSEALELLARYKMNLIIQFVPLEADSQKLVQTIQALYSEIKLFLIDEHEESISYIVRDYLSNTDLHSGFSKMPMLSTQLEAEGEEQEENESLGDWSEVSQFGKSAS